MRSTQSSKLASALVAALFAALLTADCSATNDRNSNSNSNSTWAETWRAVYVARRCGVGLSRFVSFGPARDFCALYRQNAEQAISESIAYTLARLLGVQHVPRSVVCVFNSSAEAWRAVAPQLRAVGWREGHPLVLVPFLKNLTPAHFPPALAAALRARLGRGPPAPPAALDFFADLIVFDYLTANTDRTIGNLHSLQWHDGALTELPVRNAFRISGRLVLLDHESGILHGFRRLPQFAHYFEVLLSSSCPLRPSLLVSLELAAQTLTQDDPLILLGLKPTNANANFWPPHVLRALDHAVPVIQQRLENVIRHAKSCTRNDFGRDLSRLPADDVAVSASLNLSVQTDHSRIIAGISCAATTTSDFSDNQVFA